MRWDALRKMNLLREAAWRPSTLSWSTGAHFGVISCRSYLAVINKATQKRGHQDFTSLIAHRQALSSITQLSTAYCRRRVPNHRFHSHLEAKSKDKVDEVISPSRYSSPVGCSDCSIYDITSDDLLFTCARITHEGVLKTSTRCNASQREIETV